MPTINLECRSRIDGELFGMVQSALGKEPVRVAAAVALDMSHE